jgi:hypothetical protein
LFYETEIQFVINTDSIVQDSNWFKYQEVISQIQPEDIESVTIIGSASPDGNVDFNKYLSDIRAQKIKTTLPNVADFKFTVKSIAEDYNYLYQLVYASDEPFRDEALYILSNSKDIKETLKSNRRIWRRLIDNYFQTLRSAKVYITFYDKPQECDCDTVYLAYTDTIYNTIHDTLWFEKPFKKIPILALKTNLLMDGLAAPNIQAELFTHLWGTSLEFEYTVPWWSSDEAYIYYQIADGTVGLRKYLKDSYDGHWFGLYGHTVLYDLCANKEDGWQGEGYGIGLGYGYVWRSEKHPRLRLEMYGRIGWLHTKYDTYHASDPWDGKYYYDWYKRASEFVPRRFTLDYFGPTMIGINISYDIICLRRY